MSAVKWCCDPTQVIGRGPSLVANSVEIWRPTRRRFAFKVSRKSALPSG